MVFTCDTRPFQISAFFFNPHGPCPELKFQRRSDKAVVDDDDVAVGCGTEKGLRESTAVWCRAEELVGDTKADDVVVLHANRAVSNNRMGLVANIFLQASLDYVGTIYPILSGLCVAACFSWVSVNHQSESSSSHHKITRSQLFFSCCLFSECRAASFSYVIVSRVSRNSEQQIGFINNSFDSIPYSFGSGSVSGFNFFCLVLAGVFFCKRRFETGLCITRAFLVTTTTKNEDITAALDPISSPLLYCSTTLVVYFISSNNGRTTVTSRQTPPQGTPKSKTSGRRRHLHVLSGPFAAMEGVDSGTR
jgi:hypothetical protein